MIYLFHGTDPDKIRAKALAWVAAARAKQPDAAYVRLGAGEVTPESLQEIASTQGLFFLKTLALIDDPFVAAESAEAVLEHLDMLAQSQNPIAILAPKLIPARVKKVGAKAEKVFVVDSLEKKPARGFNSALVDALGSRSGSALWLELQRAQRLGDAPEMLHALLHWKARDLMSKGSARWSREEARRLSVELIELLSEARGGGLTLAQSLERFALALR